MSATFVISITLFVLLRSVSLEEAFCGNKCFGEGIVTSRHCYCDSACSIYNDCCADSEHLNLSISSTNSNKSVICKRKALMVNGCAKEWNGPDFIINNCKSNPDSDVDPLGNAPVTSQTTGVTYNNYYCAICNGDAEKVAVWTIKISCPLLNPDFKMEQDEAFKYIFYNHPTKEWGFVLKDDDTKKMSFHGCALTSEIPKEYLSKKRHCHTDAVATCDPSWKMDFIRDLCNSYVDPVFTNGVRYKNFYCAICNRIDQSTVSCGEAIGPRTNIQPDTDDNNKLSFSLLLDINFSEGNVVGKRLATETCLKGEIFDPFARRCRNIVCGIPGFVFRNGICSSEPDPSLK